MFETVTLNGREYLLDMSEGQYRRSSIPLLRNQSDQGDRPGSQSLNPEGPWRRTQESWHHGSGQSHLDREASDSTRYGTSTGVDPWTEYTLRLHSETVRCYTPTTSVTFSLVVGNRVYVVDGAAVKFTTAPLSAGSTWTTVTGLVGVSNVKLCSDGAYVYIPQAGSGLYRVANNASAAAVWNATAIGKEAFYVLGRIIVTDTTTLSNAVDAATTTLIATLTSGRWASVTEGRGFIFAASSSQSAPSLLGTGEGTIYRIGIDSAGTGLDVPMISARLPAGEDVLSIYGYRGFLLIATSKGVRFAQEEDSGLLTLGALRTDATFSFGGSFEAFTAEGQFIYYTSSGTPSAGYHVGLGRLDLTEFIAPLTPAGASDLSNAAILAATSTNSTVTTVGTVSGNQYFGVSGSGPGSLGGLYCVSGTVTSGTITTGVIDYGLAESKIPLYIDVQTEPLPSGTSVIVALSVDGDAYTTVGTHDVDGSTSFTADLTSVTIPDDGGRFYNIRLTLTGSGSNTPVVTRLTLRTYPVMARGEIIDLPLLLDETVNLNGSLQAVDIAEEISNARALVASNALIPLVEGDATSQVYVEDFRFSAQTPTDDGKDMAGTLLLRLKTFATPTAA